MNKYINCFIFFFSFVWNCFGYCGPIVVYPKTSEDLKIKIILNFPDKIVSLLKNYSNNYQEKSESSVEEILKKQPQESFLKEVAKVLLDANNNGNEICYQPNFYLVEYINEIEKKTGKSSDLHLGFGHLVSEIEVYCHEAKDVLLEAQVAYEAINSLEE